MSDSHEAIPFAEKGSNVTFYPNTVIINPQDMHLGSNIVVSQFCTLNGGLKTVIGNFIEIAFYSIVFGGGVCLVEDFVALSAGVRIITGSEMVDGEGLPNSSIPKEFRSVSRSFVHLQKHVFLASNVVVHPGVTIGEGAVIASNSVVTTDIEPWTVNVGAPARSIRKRSFEKMKRLEKELYLRSGVVPFSVQDFLDLKMTRDFVPED